MQVPNDPEFLAIQSSLESFDDSVVEQKVSSPIIKTSIMLSNEFESEPVCATNGFRSAKSGNNGVANLL